MRGSWLNFAILALLFVGASSVEMPDTSLATSGLQGADQSLKRRVDFWIRVYTEFSISEGVIHDAQYPEIVFEKLDFRLEENDFSRPAKERQKRVQRRIKEAKEFYRKILLSIHAKQANPSKLNAAEKRVFELYKDIQEPKKFFLAAHNKRIRIQRGLKERFAEGLFYAGKYLPIMENIFRDKGVPIELTRLPFVESSFNLKARSKVGASGIWQFMRSTGKLYLKINKTIDERNDPIRATESAAVLLKQNFEALGNWPLAITAYNHGRMGLMRAVVKVGSESLSDIITGYRSRSFGFASSNFFCEFLAALEVERHSEKYFGKLQRDHPAAFSEFILNDFVSVKDLSTYTRIPLDTLIEMNPSLTDQVYSGQQYIPAGFILRIPAEMRDTFLVRYNEIPSSKKYSSQKGHILQARQH